MEPDLIPAKPPADLIPAGPPESHSIIESDRKADDYSAEMPLPREFYSTRPHSGVLDKPLLRVSPKLIKGILSATQLPHAEGGSSDQINEGIANSLSKQIEGILTPKGVGLLGASAIPGVAPLVGGYIGYQGAKGVAEGSKATLKGVQEGDLIKTTEGIADTLGSGAMVLGGAHAAKPLAKGAVGLAKDFYSEATGPRGEQAAVFPSGEMKELRDTKVLGFNPKAEIPNEQLHNRIQAVLPKSEYEMYSELGLKDQLPAGGKAKPEAIASWMEKVGPRVEVKELKANVDEPKEYTQATQELSNLSHEMENLGYKLNDFDEIMKGGVKLDNTDATIPPRALEIRAKMADLRAVQEKYIDQVQGNDSATARYTDVNPKPLDKMEGAVDLLLKVPKGDREMSLYDSNHYPQEGENLLAHVRGYMENTPDGKKVFHVFELQSDWAQQQRSIKEAHAAMKVVPRVSGHSIETGQAGYTYDIVGDNRTYESGLPKELADKRLAELKEKTLVRNPGHPLLKNYERLAVKAVIEHARKEGADSIAFSDADTAMLTEGHDRIVGNTLARHPYLRGQLEIPQEKGMRLHYDQIIPKLAKELTGDEGKVVDFGEHKNAVEPIPSDKVTIKITSSNEPVAWDVTNIITGEKRRFNNDDEARAYALSLKTARPDLLLKNPDGTPKTTITARQYSIAKARPEFTMFGSDKAASGMQIKAALERNKEAGMLGLSGPKIPHVTTPLNGKTLVPDLPAKDVSNIKHGTLFGVEKNLIVGRLMGGKRRIMDKYDAPVATWYAEEYNVGAGLTSAYAEQIRGEVNKAFIMDKDGKLNLPGDPTPKQAFKRLMQDPNAYILSKEQQAAFNNIIKPTLERMVETSKDNAIKSKLDPFRLNAATGKDVEGFLVDVVAKQYSKIAMARLRADPAMLGTSFKREIAPELQRRGDKALRAIGNINSLIKAMRLGFDFGVGQIQLLPTAFSHPTIWAKAQVLAMKSFLHEGYFTEYARANLKDIQEYAQEGGTVGKLEEYREGLGAQGQLTKTLEKIPVIGKPASGLTKAFGRQFQTALDVSKIELWKAYKDVLKDTPVERQKLARLIESMTLSGRMEGSGVHHSRAIWERALFNAPSYYRGAVEFVGAMAEGGVTGKIARRAMGKFVGGSIAMYYAVALAMGMDEDEIQSRMNPKSSKFMMWTMDDEGDQKLHFGIGNIFRSVLRLFGGIADTITNENKSLKDFKSLSSDRNPIARFLRGHAGPIPAAVWDSVTDRDYLGLKSDIGNNFIGQGLDAFVPMAAQQGQSLKERVLQTAGLNAFKGGAPTAQEVAKKLFGTRDVDSLSTVNKVKLNKEVQRLAPPKNLAERELASQRSHDNEFKRLSRLEDNLPDDQKEWLKANKLQLPTYEMNLSIQMGTKRHSNVQTIPMSKDQGDKYEGLVQQYYQQAITRLMGSGIGRLPQDEKQKVLGRALAEARERAKRSIR